MKELRIRRALLSVTDKSGLTEFAGFLSGQGVELVSTGGTMKTLSGAGLPVTAVESVTGFPEMLDGRVKTLHPHVHAGILADKDNPGHMGILDEFSLRPFDLVCVNLYAFDKAVRAGADLKTAVESIDVGGPTMLRASAKNYHSVAVVPEIDLYPEIMKELTTNGMILGLVTRRNLAARTFSLLSAYDRAISEYLAANRD
ncbi:MAG: IMP cyclohydrolase [Deltaproteobacteria bacterium]|nr:IMP cyclohydrolase [Deltaproteobacteria bacterium]